MRVPKVSSNPDVNWRNDAIQFPRLIVELEAAGAFTAKVMRSLTSSMDLEEVKGLVDRAQKKWDKIKEQV
jgi:hypothetical protein